MLWFFQAGSVAACHQLVAVTTLTASLLAYHYFDQSGVATGSGPVAVCDSVSLKYAYLLVALGVAATSTRSVNLFAKRICYASRLLGPDHAARWLAFQFGLSAFLFTTFALRMQPESLINVGSHVGCVGAASIAWAGTMSIWERPGVRFLRATRQTEKVS